MAARRILGIDPGTRFVGWGVIEACGDSVRRLDSGTWRLGERNPLRERLVLFRKKLVCVLEEWSPTEVALESAFMGKNARSALRLGEARGVALVTVAEVGIPLMEIPPALVKRRVAGAGNAGKEMIAHLVAAQVEGCEDFGSLDESDALAVALCAFLEKSGNIGHDGGRRPVLPPGAELQ